MTNATQRATNALKGPADADHFRVQVGRYHERWYCDPLASDDIADATDAAWPSVSTVKKASGSDWSYVSLGRAAAEIAAHPERIAGMEQGQIYDHMNSANKRGLEAAAKRGTNVHAACDARLAGLPAVILPGQPGVEYLPAVEAFFDAYQPELVAAEVVVINRELNGVGYGGTADAIVRIGGKTYKVDWKTRGADSNHGAYPEEAAQIAGYAHGDYLIVVGDDGQPRRAPMPALDGGLVVSIKPDGFRVYPIDLDQAQVHWCSLHAWWVARRDERAPIGKPWAPKGRTVRAPAPTAPAVDPLDRAVIVERVRAIVAAGHAERIALAWPEGVPGLAESDDHDDTQLGAILAAVRKVEDDTDAPWHPADTTAAAPTPAGATGAAPPDEGSTLVDGDVASISAALGTLNDVQRAAIGAIAAEANESGLSISLSVLPSQRRFEIARALIALARSCDLEADAARGLLALVVDSDAAEWPTIPVGQIVGSLTIAEAQRLAELAPLIGTPTLTMRIETDGRHVFEVVD